jgi:hypothetical protein
VQLEGLSQLKNPMTSTGIEPATFWLVIVPQPTTLLCAPGFVAGGVNALMYPHNKK